MRSWFDEPTTQMLIFVLFVSAGVLFGGAFSLWVSLILLTIFPEQLHCLATLMTLAMPRKEKVSKLFNLAKFLPVSYLND